MELTMAEHKKSPWEVYQEETKDYNKHPDNYKDAVWWLNSKPIKDEPQYSVFMDKYPAVKGHRLYIPKTDRCTRNDWIVFPRSIQRWNGNGQFRRDRWIQSCIKQECLFWTINILATRTFLAKARW